MHYTLSFFFTLNTGYVYFKPFAFRPLGIVITQLEIQRTLFSFKQRLRGTKTINYTVYSYMDVACGYVRRAHSTEITLGRYSTRIAADLLY